MSTFDHSAVTSNMKEVQRVSEFIVKAILDKPEFNKIHRLQPGIQMKSQILFASQLGMVGIKGGTCGSDGSGAGLKFSEKIWEPVPIKDYWEICAEDELDVLFKAYGNELKEFEDKYDITGSPMGALWAMLVMNAMESALWRLAWHADTDLVAADTGVAGISDAGLLPLYTPLDGLWKQIFAGVTGNLIENTTIQATPSATFRAVHKQAHIDLRKSSEKVFMVTRDIFEDYIDELETTSKAFTIDYLVYGLPAVKWRGIDVINMETVWDHHFDNFIEETGGDVILPSRVVLSTPANLPLGTLNSNDLSKLKIWYDENTEKVKTKFGFTLDAKVLEEDLISTAYGSAE